MNLILFVIVGAIYFEYGGCSEKKDVPNTVSVYTAPGEIIGKRKGPVNVFLGIPYAEPPVGTLRFRPSKPKLPWYPRVLEAFKFSAECLQSLSLSTAEEEQIFDDGHGDPLHFDRVQSEDCLYLNIWTPADATPESHYPVLFWIYGGAFLHGASSRAEYIGDRLAARGTIVVSINYRLGALGFLVSTADGLYGNYGLHDQKVALQWVQDNIRRFGGDPDRVTVFGESAGAMSTGLHLLDQHRRMENERNSRFGFNRRPEPPRQLFHSVIIQSNPMGYK
jgi:carboxylesterase type B